MRLRSAPPRFTAAPARVAGLSTSGTGFARTDGASSTARGYGADWRKVRASVLRDRPTCEMCRTAPSAEVDHIRPFHGLADPLRLSRPNLRALCAPCHRSRTARQSHGAKG